MLLQERDRQVVRKRLEGLDKPIHLINFTQELECEFCRETRMLLEEVAALSEKVSLEVYNFQTDRDKRDAFGIDKIPAAVIMGDRERFLRRSEYGIGKLYDCRLDQIRLP